MRDYKERESATSSASFDRSPTSYVARSSRGQLMQFVQIAAARAVLPPRGALIAGG